jgi:polyphosphate kinase
LHSLLQSPFGFHGAILAKLARETEHALDGQPARVIAKMNALVDPQAIEALYRASCAGVQIDLIVRGVCALRPGVPGVSDNIRVRSILGRFLEHSRVFYFENAGAPQMYCSSADWMERNFFRRVEVAFPITRLEHRERILSDLNVYLKDNSQAWLLSADGTYVLAAPREEAPLSAQSDLLGRYAAASGLSL